jgi:indolepyruvate ferredoxin oxidoreductase
MGWLRHGKMLRGTALDPFGRTEERRTERALIEEYRAGVERLLRRLSPATHATVCDWAEAAAGIRGFGHVKAANITRARERMEQIEAGLDAPAAKAAAEKKGEPVAALAAE